MNDTMTLIGVRKDGSSEVLGELPITPQMKARELASEYFGKFTIDNGSDADCCYWAMIELIDWMESR